MGVVTKGVAAGDRAAGGLARLLSTAGQVGLLALGVHLAADRLDDLAHHGILAGQAACERWLAGPLWALAETLGLAGTDLFFWTVLPEPVLAASLALAVELSALAILASSFLLTPRDARPRLAAWRQALGLQAVVLPVVLAATLAAGSWSLAMALEDLLPPSQVSGLAASVVALAAGLHYGLGAWCRAVAALEPPDRWSRGLLRCLILTPVGVLALVHGLPVWGWLP